MLTVKRTKGPGAIELKNILATRNMSLKVGWFANSRYDEGDQEPVAAIAAQNEFGNPNKNIPARPFMRPTIEHREQYWRKLSEKLAKAIEKGQFTQKEALKTLGHQVVFDVQKTITNLTTPILSPVTIAHRLSRYKDQKTIGQLTKPLVDTGVMLGSIYAVVEE